MQHRPNEQPTVDYDVLTMLREQTFDGETDLVPELIETFLNEVPDNCRELASVVESGDATAVRKRAHYLKSSTVNLGAVRMTTMCAGLESLARSGDLTGAEAYVRGINEELALVEECFRRYLRSR